MVKASQIKTHYEVIGADGVHIGTVERVEKDRIKLSRKDSGHGDGKQYYISLGLVADVEGKKVRLSANADVAVTLEDDH